MSSELESLSDRELDALVAQKIFGWRWHIYDVVNLSVLLGPIHEERKGVRIADSDEGVRAEDWDRHLPRYSTQIAAAWKVLEKVATGYRDFRVDNAYVVLGKREYFATVVDQADVEPQVSAIAETAPRAICLAALKTVKERNGSKNTTVVR